MEKTKKRTHIIILIEEDEKIIEKCKKCLCSVDFKVITTPRGKDGIKLAIKHRPDLIITDLVMPKIDGFELLRRLKIEEKTKDIPVIVLSNVVNKKDKEEAKNLGAIDYLVKSRCQSSQIAKKISKLLKNKK